MYHDFRAPILVLEKFMAPNWDDIEVYYGDDPERDAWEATHSGGFHIETGDDDAFYGDDSEE